MTLKLLQKGDRFLPIEIETKLKGGSVHRTWYKNHLWRFRDTFVYFVPEEPCQVILDPDGYTVDFDRRNNQSGWMNHEFLFRWPGMNYEP